MTKEQFGQTIKQKYPEYNDLSDAELADKWVAKYPVYADKIDQPVQQVQQQDGIFKAIAKDIASTLLVRPAARATEAITRTAFPSSEAAQGYEAMANEGQNQNIAGIVVPQVKGFGEGGAKQITGEALQSVSYLLPYGQVAGVAGKVAGKIGGNIIAGATGGYASDVGTDLADGKSVKESLMPGAGTALGVAVPLAGPALRATGRATQKLGAKAYDLVIPTSAREAKILQTYKANVPFTERVMNVLKGTEGGTRTTSKTALETTAGQSVSGLFGTKTGIGIQAKRASNSLWKDVIQPRLDKAEFKVDLPKFFKKKAQDIVTNNPEISRQNALLEALDAIKEDYKDIGEISLAQLQKYKEGWAKFVPDKAYNGKPIAGAFNDVRNELSGEARQTIYNQLGDDVKQAYFDYGNLQGLQALGQSSMTGAKLKAGAGTFTTEVLSQAITPIATVGGQMLYRTGKGIELVGKTGAKTVGDALQIKIPLAISATKKKNE